MLNPVEQSLGGASDVHRGVWIQAPILLGQRELVGTVANIPHQRGCAGLYGQSAPAPRAASTATR